MRAGARSITWLAAAAALLILLPPAIASSPTPGKVYRVAILSLPSTPLPQVAAGIELFRRELRGLGWVEGRNVVIEQRHVDRDGLDEAAARVVRERFDLIVTMAIPAALAAKKATTTIPIVMATSADPVGSGLVESLARPGGNITGLSFAGHELRAKRLELLREIVPRLGRVAAIYPERSIEIPYVTQWLSDNERAARALGLTLQRVAAKLPADWDATFATAKRGGAEALVVVESPDLIAQAEPIAAAALKHRLPSIFGSKVQVVAGGLMAYGSTVPSWGRAAVYVDKILRGAKPADLPVEESSKFDLVINARTAKGLGLTIPSVLRLQAAEVIE